MHGMVLTSQVLLPQSDLLHCEFLNCNVFNRWVNEGRRREINCSSVQVVICDCACFSVCIVLWGKVVNNEQNEINNNKINEIKNKWNHKSGLCQVSFKETAHVQWLAQRIVFWHGLGSMIRGAYLWDLSSSGWLLPRVECASGPLGRLGPYSQVLPTLQMWIWTLLSIAYRHCRSMCLWPGWLQDAFWKET